MVETAAEVQRKAAQASSDVGAEGLFNIWPHLDENDKDEDEDVHVTEAEKIQESRVPRNLQESVEEEAPQESWEEGYSTLSIPPGTFAFNEPYRSNLHSLEEQQVNLAPDVDKIEKDQEEEEDQGPLCPRLSMELVEAEEPEVFWYSLDIFSVYCQGIGSTSK
ncbi:hypothetical protein P7K49_017386 [Saguinus oedipus]|uniref:Olduvai domain-containing protein n=1 Tax=Saguinus oedipus TaxID=9490 RepID=A0ABQ9V3D0_SAGOE|nr:hypothetical protein P7K49_017386 [Saguinus oedipus]